jgi:hypothetical protein
LCDCGEHAWAVLTQGFVTFVSPEDASMLAQRNWYAKPASQQLIYAAAKRDGRLHRILLGEPDDHIDHKDRNGLNNRRSNLRPCTRSQNLGNSRKRSNKTGFRGVYLEGRTGRWCAMLSDQHLGTFDTPEAAARAYDAAAIERFGDFATTNFGGEA